MSRTARRMLALSAAVAGVAALSGTSRADTFANNGGLDLSQPGNWIDLTVGGTDPAPPSTNDIAQWDINDAAGGSFILNTTTPTWLGITLINPGGAVIIGTGAADGSLTLGASGINMSAATQNLTIADPLTLAVNQTWNVGGSQVLSDNSTLNLNPGAAVTLTIAGSGNTSLNTTASIISGAGGSIVKTGAGTLALGGVNTFTGTVSADAGLIYLHGETVANNTNTVPGNISILPSGSTLAVGGGTVNLNAGSGTSGSAAWVDQVGTLSVQAGGGSITESRGGSDRAIFTFSNLNDATGGTVNFVDVVNAVGGNNKNGGGYRTSATAEINGVVPFITYTTSTSGTSPAGGLLANNPVAMGWFVPVNTSNSGSALATYTNSNDTSLGTASTQNVDVVNGTSTNNANITGLGATVVNTLRFNSGNSHAIIMGPTDSLTVGTGGILVTGAYTTHNGQINGGTLEGGNPGSGSGNDLMIIDYEDPANSGSPKFTISSTIIDNTTNATPGATALTKSGSGTLVLSNTANTYSGVTYLNGGITNIAADDTNVSGTLYGSLGLVPTSPVANNITFSGGTLQLAGAFNLDSNRGITLNAAGGTFDINGHASSYGGIITGIGPFTKAGTNTLQLSGASTYTGNTTVSVGTLAAMNTSGSATGSGNVSVSNGAVLGGTGSVSGTVTLTSNATVNLGGAVQPGLNGSVGTLSVGGLTFNTGSSEDAVFASTTSYGVLDVTNPNGLTINGGGIDLYQTGGTTTAFSSVGTHTYDLIEYSGSIQGSAFTAVNGWTTLSGTNPGIANPQASTTYQFGTATVGGNQFITLTVNATAASVASNWISTGTPNSNWDLTDTQNWQAGSIPQNPGDTANFVSTASTVSPINLTASLSVGTLNFNGSPYTIQGSSTLTMSTGTVSSAAINDLGGTQIINVPMTLASNTVVNVTNSVDTLTLGGNINGSGALTIGSGGIGTVVLGGTNTYGGNTTITSGTLVVTGTLGGTNVADNGILIFNQSASHAIGGTISGTGTLTQAGATTLTLSGSNTYQGGTSITNGTVQLGSTTALGTGSVTINTPGILDVHGFGATLPGLVGTGIVDNITATPTEVFVNTAGISSSIFSGTVQNSNASGPVTLDKLGTGTQTLSGTNTYTGGTTIDAGDLVVNSASSLGATTGALTINSGTLEANTTFSTGRSYILGASTTPTIEVDSVGSPAVPQVLTLTNAAGLTGTGTTGFTKSGGGTLVVAGPYTMAGATTITGGTLDLQNASNTMTTVPVTSSGTLEVDAAPASLTLPAFTVGVGSTASGQLLINGGTFTATGTVSLAGVSESGGGGVITIEPGSNATFTSVNYSGSADGGIINILGGTANFTGTVTVGRSGATGSGSSAVPDFNKGIIVNGATANATFNAITLGTTNSYATMTVENGATVNVTGPFLLSDMATGGTGPIRGGKLQVTGGTLVSTDPSGLQMAANTLAGATDNQAAGATFTGGTTTLTGITMFPQGAPTTSGAFSATVTVGNGTVGGTSTGALYLGTVGIAYDDSTNASVGSVVLNGGTIIGASGSWSSPTQVAWTLNNVFSIPTIQAADANGNPFNITINGALSGNGSGSFIKTGGGTLTIGGVDSTYGGNTNVNAGTLAIGPAGSFSFSTIDVNSTAALSFTAETGGAGNYARNVFGVTLNGGNAAVALASPQNTNRSVVVFSQSGTGLVINSGSLDLSNNDMLLPSGISGGGTSGLLTTSNQIAQGFNAGHAAWSGTSGITSSAAAANSQRTTGLAVIINDVNASQALVYGPVNPASSPSVIVNPSYSAGGAISSLGGGSGLFDGQGTNDGDVLVKYTYFGDTNLDGVVNASDYLAIDSAFNANQAILANPGANPNAYLEAGWANGDFNYDGLINGDDYTMMDNAFNSQAGVTFTGVSAGPANMIAGNTELIAGSDGVATPAAVPEPATLSLLGMAAVGMLGRRRRRTK